MERGAVRVTVILFHLNTHGTVSKGQYFDTKDKMDHKQRKLLLACLFVCVVGIVIGVLIGYFASRYSKGPCLGSGIPHNIISEADDTITQKNCGWN